MERFFGFDLGDAESAISRLDKEGQTVPEVLSIRDSKSFITAYARLRNHDLLIGENACYNPNAVERKIRFKSKFLTDKESSKDVKSFAAGVLGELYLNGDLIKNEDCCFYIGCPAGWDKTAPSRVKASSPPLATTRPRYWSRCAKAGLASVRCAISLPPTTNCLLVR